ncbi:MAG: sugar ABC transporter permease [Firmicutes bacterium]|nr:sugar ABC transporter permease [Bacillota bacterium]
MASKVKLSKAQKAHERQRTWQNIKKNKWLYVMFAPVLIYYIIFKYVPMVGIVIAFKNYNVFKGIWASPWVGFQQFQRFFNSIYAWRLIRNTFLISFYGLIFGFPAPILLALLLNELKDGAFKKVTQTISYLPHFLSSVIIAGIVTSFLRPETGLFNNIRAALGLERIYFLIYPQYFRTIYTTMGIWAGIGWGSIIYLAALTGVDPELYEACIIDGGGRFRQTLHITIPGILPTITIMLIMRIGQLLSVGSDTILLLYTPSTYITADVISTYVYRVGLIDANYSFSAAVGLFNSVIAMVLLTISNSLSKRFGETSLW